MTESGQNGHTATDGFTRRRGVGFPVVPLPEAVTILRKAGAHGHEYSMNAFAAYAGHSTANSGSFKRRLAAFRDWKLVAGSTGDRVVLTELGLRLAYPTDPLKEKQDVQEAFQNCNLFMRVWDDYAKGVPISLGTLANLGVQQLGVAPVSKERFAESLALSAVAAGFAEQVGERISFIRPGVTEAPDGLDADEEKHGPTSIHSDGLRPMDFVGVGARAQAAEVAAGVGVTEVVEEEKEASAERVVRAPEEKPAALLHKQSWEIGGGSLTLEIRSSRSLPSDAFVQIGEIMREVEKLKALLIEGAETGSGESR
jgi:hypothetical protein